MLDITKSQVARILSGSCTPASDLLVLVNSGRLTYDEANRALLNTGRKVANVTDAANLERAHIRALDI